MAQLSRAAVTPEDKAKVEDGVLTLAALADVRCARQLPGRDVRCLSEHVRCLSEHVRCLSEHVRCLTERGVHDASWGEWQRAISDLCVRLGPTLMKHPELVDPWFADAKLEVLAARCGYRSRALADALGMSLRQLQRAFLVHFHCGARRWLREERLRAARRLLPSAGSVKEVAYALGFTQPSQFSRDFKALFGSTPAAWLRQPGRPPAHPRARDASDRGERED
jgi:AraC-like DNA-binding protein